MHGEMYVCIEGSLRALRGNLLPPRITNLESITPLTGCSPLCTASWLVLGLPYHLAASVSVAAGPRKLLVTS